MKIPAECMSGLTVPAGLWWFHRVVPGQPRTTLAFLHLNQDSRAKCVFRSRIAWFDVDSVSLSLIISKFRYISKSEILNAYPFENLSEVTKA